MTPFEIKTEQESNSCVVRLAGDIDMAVAPSLRASLDAVLGEGCINVVLDLSEVAYADSSALGLLVWLDHRLRPLGGRLVLAGAQPDVARILELSGLVSVAASIAMSQDVTGALDGLQMPPVTTGPEWERTISVPAEVDALSDAREQICEIIQPLGFSTASLFDIKVALGEALANAIRHGAPNVGAPEVKVRICAYEDRVILEVTDNGVGFDGRHVSSGDIYAPNGRGIMFMRALMDKVEFDTSASGGTLVRLAKHRAGAA